VLVRRVEDVQGASFRNRSLERQGKRIVPSLTSVVERARTPSVFFCAYPDRSNAAKNASPGAVFSAMAAFCKIRAPNSPRRRFRQRSGPDSGSRPARRE